MLEIMNPKSGYKDLNVTKNVINEKKQQQNLQCMNGTLIDTRKVFIYTKLASDFLKII